MVWLVSGFFLAVAGRGFFSLTVRVGVDCRAVFWKSPICECLIHIMGFGPAGGLFCGFACGSGIFLILLSAGRFLSVFLGLWPFLVLLVVY
jgi:hypothetical protein